MIDIHRHGDIHELRLNRPPVNALNHALLDALVEAVEAAPGQGARGLILAGGEKVFSGGLDVPFLMTLDDAALGACWSRFFDAARAIAKSAVPIVAAIAGHNPAGGCVLALCCDFRVMARGPFRIGLNETQVGLVVPDAIQHLMRRVLGAHRTERMVVAGALVESEQALAMGLVDELTDAAEVVTRARHWLEELLKLPSTPMLASRRIARDDIITALEGFGDAQIASLLDAWRGEDTQMALRALLARLKK